MKQISDKRSAMNAHYQRVKKELEKELKSNDQWFCFFSGIPFPDHYTWKEVTWHHCAGRTETLLIEKEFLRPVLDQYHTGDEGYHNIPLSKLRTLWWFEGYTRRLKQMSIDMYQQLMYKLESIDNPK